MRLSGFVLSSFAFVAILGSCSSKRAVVVESTRQHYQDSVAYAYGVLNAEAFLDNIKNSPVEVDSLHRESILRGFADRFEGKANMSGAQAKKLFEGYIVSARQAREVRNRALSDSVLLANKAKPGVVVTESGLQYRVIRQGDGPKPQPQDTVEVHYRGSLVDGREFDSSYARGKTSTFPLDRVIKGWTEGLCLMSKGSKFEFFIPSDLAYGERGAGANIPPYSALVFEVELVDVKPAKRAVESAMDVEKQEAMPKTTRRTANKK